MVALAQASSATKVRVSALMLANENVDTLLRQASDAEIAGKIPIGDDDITWAKFVHQSPQHRGFTRLLALARANRPLQYGATGQRNDTNQAGQREAQPGLLSLRLWEHLLVALGIRHRNSGSIDEFDVTAAPQPWRRLRRQ